MFHEDILSDFEIVVSRANIALSYQTINQWNAYLFSFLLM